VRRHQFKQRFPLETEDGRKLNAWKLLIQSEQKILNQGKFMRAARIFAKQVKKYGGIFIKYAGETAELVCTSGAIY
jgi:hypothetical protein